MNTKLGRNVGEHSPAITRFGDVPRTDFSLLTVVVPNYNRASALERLLESVFASIDFANAGRFVKVLVVDDYSSDDLSAVICKYHRRDNFGFCLQHKKCGNAETAFLSAMGRVDTEYCWLLGNDDWLAPDAVDSVLKLLIPKKLGFVLLNPLLVTESRRSVPINASAPLIYYAAARDLFADFGFVTSTTTFPCILFRTEPVRRFHQKNNLSAVARVYSHTFTLFSALLHEPAIFFARPIVNFTLNDRLEEHVKLMRQAPGRVAFYHHTVGLTRLIRACAAKTGLPITWFGTACEDEVNKDNFGVEPTVTSHFLLFFFVQQLISELQSMRSGDLQSGYLCRSEIEEIGSLIAEFDDSELIRMYHVAIEDYCAVALPGDVKIARLSTLRSRSKELARRKYVDSARALARASAKKIFSGRGENVPTRGLAFEGLDEGIFHGSTV